MISSKNLFQKNLKRALIGLPFQVVRIHATQPEITGRVADLEARVAELEYQLDIEKDVDMKSDNTQPEITYAEI